VYYSVGVVVSCHTHIWTYHRLDASSLSSSKRLRNCEVDLWPQDPQPQEVINVDEDNERAYLVDNSMTSQTIVSYLSSFIEPHWTVLFRICLWFVVHVNTQIPTPSSLIYMYCPLQCQIQLWFPVTWYAWTCLDLLGSRYPLIYRFFCSLNNCFSTWMDAFLSLWSMLNEFDGLKPSFELSLSLIFWILNWAYDTYQLC